MKCLASFIALAVTALSLAHGDAASDVRAAELAGRKDRKPVMVIFHASWCGWCHKLDKFLEDPAIKPIMDANYTILHIDVQEQPNKKSLETPGGDDVQKRFHAETQGLPFFVFLDADDKLLYDSAPKDAKGKPANIGYPAEPGEIAYFMKALRGTAHHLSAADADRIEATLRKK